MMIQGKKQGFEYRPDRLPIWHMVGEFLETRQYEQAAEFLHKAQLDKQQTGDGIVVDILVAARQICLIVNQCRAEIEWHRQAAEQASRREQQLGQQLQTMLVLANGGEAPGIQAEPNETPAASTVEIRPDIPPADKIESPPDSPPLVGKKEQPGQDSTLLIIYCLGPFQVYQNNQLIADWSSLKARSIFKYLVARRGAPIAKDILMDVFWPDAEPEAARRNLHQAIYSLRQTLKQGRSDFQPIQFENDCYLLNPELEIWLDYTEFEKRVQAGQRLEAAGRFEEAAVEYNIAGGIYRGDFLEEDLYEDWPILQREYLRTMYLDLIDRLSEYYAQQGKYTKSITLCQKILTSDNCHEETHRRLMQCYLDQNQRSLAARQYQSCVQALKTELGVPPSAETQTLYEQIVEDARDFALAELETLAC